MLAGEERIFLEERAETGVRTLGRLLPGHLLEFAIWNRINYKTR